MRRLDTLRPMFLCSFINKTYTCTCFLFIFDRWHRLPFFLTKTESQILNKLHIKFGFSIFLNIWDLRVYPDRQRDKPTDRQARHPKSEYIYFLGPAIRAYSCYIHFQKVNVPLFDHFPKGIETALRVHYMAIIYGWLNVLFPLYWIFGNDTLKHTPLIS